MRCSGSVALQVDNAAYFDKQFYEVETKWQARPVGGEAVSYFAERLNVAGKRGLFISVSGFAPTAVAVAGEKKATRPILLLDSDELRLAPDEVILVDRIVSEKQHHLLVDADPYHKVQVGESSYE